MKPALYQIITKKREGKELTLEEIELVLSGYVQNTIPDYQIAALLMAICFQGLTDRELWDLTKTMIASGDFISLHDIDGPKIDKHSTGGVGDKVSFVVAPLVAACGVKVPMISGRALGHTGGTLDKLESIPGMKVSLTTEEFKKTLKKIGMVIAGQTENFVPADRKLYALRDATATVNSIPLIASSIMSKKLALGTDGIVLDVKCGRGGILDSEEETKALCKTLLQIAKKEGRAATGLITNMDPPLGRAVGNSLEIIESIKALQGKGPEDLMEVTLALGATMLVTGGVQTSLPEARKELQGALHSGKALEIFSQFIEAQQGDPRICQDTSILPTCAHTFEMEASQKGFLSSIDAREVGLAAIDIGAGRRTKEDRIDYGAGFVFHKKVGDSIQKGDSLATIHTNSPQAAESALSRLQQAISISTTKVPKPKMVL